MTNHRAWLSVLATASLLLPLSSPAPAADEAGFRAAAPVYVPPLRGAPRARVGGGTRGPAEAQSLLQALVPDHTGLTVMSQPSLYWYASGPTVARLEVTLMDDEAYDPLLEVGIDCVVGCGGMQRLNLADHGIELLAGHEYEWSVALVVDPARRSSDVIAAGRIKRVEPSSPLQAALAAADRGERAAVYASHGLWYDALAAISELIERSPDDSRLRAHRAALLEQVGLSEVATHDRSNG